MELNRTQVASIKRIHSTIKSYELKNEKLRIKMTQIEAEIEANQKVIDSLEDSVVAITGGMTSKEVLDSIENQVSVQKEDVETNQEETWQ